jgi:SAM-dependent methyltransferase/DNA-binding transcriptional ArsR family regulator
MNAVPEHVPFGAPVLDGLALLADPTRSRLLAILDGIELTVAELCDTLALPQSTVSRHLKTLGDAGWVAARRDGASRYYGLTVDRLPESSQRLWELVRADVASSLEAGHDRRRLQPVLDRRRVGSAQFFSTAAGQWDDLRAELFGATSDLRILPALLPPDCIVGDLGCGSGRIAAALAPFVGAVVAVDSSSEMLAVARERINGTGNVRICEGSLEALPIDDATLDLALVVHVLHHVPEPALALAEAARVLKPGGRLLVADVLPHARQEYRRTMGHIWLGFDRATIEDAFSDAGLDPGLWHELSIEAGAKGPGLFVATATRPAASPQGGTP